MKIWYISEIFDAHKSVQVINTCIVFAVQWPTHRIVLKPRSYLRATNCLWEEKKTNYKFTTITLYLLDQQAEYIQFVCMELVLLLLLLLVLSYVTFHTQLNAIYITDYQVCPLTHASMYLMCVDSFMYAAKSDAKQQNIAHRIITYRNLIFIATFPSTNHSEISACKNYKSKIPIDLVNA